MVKKDIHELVKNETLAELVFKAASLIEDLENEDELNNEMAELLEDANNKIEAKVDNIAVVVKMLEHRTEELKSQKSNFVEMFSGKIKVLENKIANMKQYTRTYLDKVGITQAKGVLTTSSFNSKRVDSVDLNKVETVYHKISLPEINQKEFEAIIRAFDFSMSHDMDDEIKALHDKFIEQSNRRVLPSDLPKDHPAITYKITPTITIR